MNRQLIALAVVLLVLGSVARISCGGDATPLAAPDAPAATGASGARADLVVPGRAAEERSDAATPATPDEDSLAPGQDAGQEPPPLITGMVVEGRGIGVPDATVRVERHIVDAGRFGMRMVEIKPLPALTARTDAEGHFEVRGEETGEVVVLAGKEGYVLEQEVECSLPATRVTLVLERAGAILVTVAEDALGLADEVGVEVRSAGGDRDVDHAYGPLRTGRARRGELPPGSYDVALVGRVDRRPLYTVPGVPVRAGETTADPRLQELDLRGLLQEVRVTVVDPEGRPMPGVTVRVHQPFGTTGVPTGEDGSLVLATGPDGVDVSVQAEGWRHVKHEGVTEDLVVPLERPLTVRLVRPAGRSAELGDLYLYVEPMGAVNTGVGGRDASLQARADAVELGLSAPGTYRVVWAATVSFGGRGTSNVYPRDVEPQVFEVPEGAGTVEVTLTFDPGDVDALLARVQALREELAKQPGESDDQHERRVMEVLLREFRGR